MEEYKKPYGAPTIEDHPRGLVGADDSLAYVKKKKYAVVGQGHDMMKEAEAEPPEQSALPEEEPAVEKFKKVDWKKRHDDLKRHHDSKINSLKSEMQDLTTQIAENRPKFSPPKTPEELATFRAENPDIYDVVETVAHMRASEETENLKTSLASVQEKLMYEEAARAYAELKVAIPDFEAVRTSEDFHQWAKAQPAEIQAWVYENKTNAQLAAKAINLYKADRGVTTSHQPTTRNVDNRGSAADSIQATRTVDEPQSNEVSFTTSEIGSMSWQEYEARKDEIDAAHRAGRVVRG